MLNYTYPFTEAQAQAAYETWGANCGPTSLAFALQIGLDKVRGKIPGFEEKHYTSPMMMKAALEKLGVKYEVMPFLKARDGRGLMAEPIPPSVRMFHQQISLCRIQWCGPWTKPGVNPKWAYRQTHWIAAWEDMREHGWDGEMRIRKLVFDCNGGIREFASWEQEIVPAIVANYPRADGAWFPTHCWRIDS